MSTKMMVGASLFAVASVFAQYGFDSEGSENTSASAAPVYAPVTTTKQETAAPAFKADFDKIRGNAYNPFGNEAAASVVDDFYSKPHTVHGNRLAYFEPTTEKGFASFGGKDNTYFLGLDNSDDLGQLLVGMGTKAFGFTAAISLGKYSESVKTNSTSTTNVTEEGDYLGGVFSMPMGDHELSVGLEWYTFADQVSVDNGGEMTASNYDLNLLVSLGNAPSAKELSWTGEVGITRHNESIEMSNNTAVSPDNYIEVTPAMNVGSKVLGNDRARVFLGATAGLPFRMYDNIKDVQESALEVALFITPNILAELAVTENWLLFGGAAHIINLATYGGYTQINGTNKTEYSVFQMHSYPSQVNLGMRYQKNNFAVEAALSDNLFSNGTSEIFNGTNVLATFGGILYF